MHFENLAKYFKTQNSKERKLFLINYKTSFMLSLMDSTNILILFVRYFATLLYPKNNYENQAPLSRNQSLFITKNSLFIGEVISYISCKSSIFFYFDVHGILYIYIIVTTNCNVNYHNKI